MGSNQYSTEISVGKIKGAKRVTVGPLVEGAAPDQQFAWVRDLMANKITVDEIIDSDDVVTGPRILSAARGTASPTLDDLQRELSAIRAELDEVQAAQGSAAQRRLDDARHELATVSDELAEAEPDEGRVLDKLKSATDILVKVGEAADAAEGLGSRLGKIAPYLAILYTWAKAFFGV